jgi:O-antigen ligase
MNSNGISRAMFSAQNIFLFFMILIPLLGRLSLAVLMCGIMLLSIKLILRARLYKIYTVFALILIVSILSFYNAIDKIMVMRESGIAVAYFCLSIYVAVLIQNYGLAFIPKVFKAYLLSTVVISIIYILYGLGIVDLVHHIELLKTNNHFAYYVGGGVIIAFTDVLIRRKNKLILFVVLSLNIIAIYFSNSRGAFVAIVFSLLLLMIRKSKKAIIPIMAACIIFILCFEFLPQDFQLFVSSITNTTTKFSNLERIGIWTASLEIFKDNFLLGVGAGNWSLFYSLPEYFNSTNLYPHAHSFYIQTACELGIFGLALYCFLLFKCMRYSISIYKKNTNRDIRFISLSLFIFLIYSAIYGFFNNPFYNNKPISLLFIFIGITISLYKTIKFKSEVIVNGNKAIKCIAN